MEVSISMPGDLHNHSTCSDGSVSIHRLPLMAARAGLDTMAISDHDTLLSVNYCYEHPVQDGVHLLPAAELTTSIITECTCCAITRIRKAGN